MDYFEHVIYLNRKVEFKWYEIEDLKKKVK